MWHLPASPFICFLDLRRTSRTDSGEVLSSDKLEFLLVFTDSSFEIADWIRRNIAMISSWLDELDFSPLDDWGVSFSSSDVLLEAELLQGGLRLPFSSDLMLETVNWWKSFGESNSEGLSAVSAKFKKLHQKMIFQSLFIKRAGQKHHYIWYPIFSVRL